MTEAPDEAQAFWAIASDGVRLRMGVWPRGDRGTILLFPGRTEYIEKYAHTAAAFGAQGYATLAVDWRGQGLSDRLLADAHVGHVGHMRDYQLDVAAMLEVAQAQGLPCPYFLVAHSMGGCIGLRSLHDGLAVNAAMFSAPMWGLGMAPHLRPVAWGLSWASRRVGQAHHYAPGTSKESYVIEAPFDDNTLTNDPVMWHMMNAQVTAHPELALAGPSLQWVHESLLETRRLRNMVPPDYPTLTYLGTDERIVDTRPIHQVMRRWTGGRLEMVAGAEHEVLMETPDIRQQVIAGTVALFNAHS